MTSQRLLWTLLIGSIFGAPASAQNLSGLEIMERVEESQRATSDSAFNRMQLSTCRFGIKDNRITCAERPGSSLWNQWARTTVKTARIRKT